MKTKAILYIILSLIGVGYTVICFITGIQAYSKIDKNPLALSNLIHNWRSTPITDIKAMDGDVCKNGYTPMLTRYWPGTKEGCSWDEGHTIKVKDGTCPKNCEEIPAQEKIAITNMFGKRLCVKRSGSNILKAVRPNINNRTECTEKGYKPCGSGDSSHEVWVLSSNDCPIDNLIINKQSKVNNYHPVQLNDGYYLHFTTNSSALPIVDFTITEGNVWIFNDEYDKPKDKPIYPLLKTWKYNGWENTIGNLRYDNSTRWENVASRTEKELYSDNPELMKKIEKLPGYKVTDSQYFLYTRPYIEWTLKCQTSKEADMEEIAEDNNPINTLANVQLIYCIITCLALIVIGVVSPGFIIYKQLRALIGYRELDHDIIASNGMRLISGILAALVLAFLLSAYFIINDFNDLVDFVEHNNCTDKVTLDIFIFLRGVLKDANRYNLFGLYAVSVMACTEIIATLALCILSCLVRKQERASHFVGKRKKSD